MKTNESLALFYLPWGMACWLRDYHDLLIFFQGHYSNIIDVIVNNKERIIFNANVRADSSKLMEPYSPRYDERLEVASYLNKKGVKTIINIDPVIINVDLISDIEKLLVKIKDKGINRVMFSVLMLSDDLLAYLREHIQEDKINEILSAYDFTGELKQVIKDEEDTIYYFPRKERI